MKPHWLLHDRALLEEAKRLAAQYVPTFRPGEPLAHNTEATYEQHTFAWGNPGTIAAHSLDTENADRTVQQDGSGNYTAFLRIQIHQTSTNADLGLTEGFRLQYSTNGGTNWNNVGAAGATGVPVRVYDDANNTDGATLTTQRLTNSGDAYVAGRYDEGDGIQATITYTSPSESEYLWALEFVDAELTAGTNVDFRVVEDDATLMTNDATSDKPRLTWNAASQNFTADETEGIKLSDEPSYVFGNVVSVADQVALSDEPTEVTQRVGLAADQVALSDEPTVQVDYTDTVADQVALSDEPTNASVLTEAETDGVVLSDETSEVSGFQQAATEGARLGDTAEYYIPPPAGLIVVTAYNDIQGP